MKIKIPSTKFESRIRAFCGELIAKEIAFKLASYLGGEWSCLKGSATRERLERASVCVTGAFHLKKMQVSVLNQPVLRSSIAKSMYYTDPTIPESITSCFFIRR
jgi:hypothetical protein